MAGEWIKLDLSTPDKPEVFKIARIIGIDPDAVIGKLLRLWSWVDSISLDGVVDGVVSTDVDRVCRCSGFSAACSSVGWMIIDDASERITLPNFDNHNGETAKQRALKNRRQAKWRAGLSTQTSTPPSTTSSTREEKRREEKKEQERTRGTRLPVDWKPNATETVWAENERPDVNVAMEAAKFADYWHGVPGAKGVKLDWTGTWRNWIRRADGVRSGGFAAPTAGTPRRRRELGA